MHPTTGSFAITFATETYRSPGFEGDTPGYDYTLTLREYSTTGRTIRGTQIYETGYGGQKYSSLSINSRGYFAISYSSHLFSLVDGEYVANDDVYVRFGKLA